MSENAEKHEKPDTSGAKEPDGQSRQPPLPEKKRRALLTYMSILFCAAFILVLMSFLIQLRDSNSTISELSQTSTSALANAQRLQEDNSALLQQVDELQQQLEALQNDIAALETERDVLQQQLDVLQEEQNESGDALSSAEDALEEQKKTTEAYRLLSELQRVTDRAAIARITQQLEPYCDYLDAASKTLYEQYLAVLDAPSEDGEN